ncbi:MAG: hypothetical protein A2901_02700 [Elusimicrobia bacterium RIFCSPLOWO2_01_FULL_54_10]|nr:MAG: hypothetical protein A2901_02700 [Elusimicrobia bacterium RIFCSPLOWO2_01_FULL_54_10]
MQKPISPSTRDFKTPLLLFIAALLIRLIYLFQIKDIPFFSQPIIDPLEYDRLARMLLTAKEALRSTAFYQAPGYSYFLAFVYKVFGGDSSAAHVVQVVFGAFNVVLLYHMAKLLFNKPTAILSSLILAFYGPMIFYEGDFYREPLLAVAAVACFILLWRAKDSRSLGAWLAAGAAYAACVSIRENMLLFAPILLFLIWQKRKQVLWVRTSLVFFLPFAALVAFVSHKNFQATGERVFVASQSGLGFYMGNQPQMDRWTTLQPGIEYDQLSRMPLLKEGITSSKEASRWYHAKTFRFILRNPGSWLKIMFKKFMLFWGSYEFMPNEGVNLYRDESPVLRFLMFRLGSFSFPFGLLAPLAVLGLALAFKEKKEAAVWIGIMIAVYMASFLIFHVRARFRIPVIPFFAMLGAYGALRLVRQIREKSWAALAKPAGIFLACAALFNAPLYNFSYAEQFPKNYFTAKSFHSVKNYEKALPLYLEAVKDGLSPAEVHNDLAVLYSEQGQREAAASELEKSVALAPDYDKMRVTLGILYAESGNLAKGREHFQKAVDINPYNPYGRLNLGITLEKVDAKAAEDQYNKILELSKTFPMTEASVIQSAKEGLWRLGKTNLSDSQVIPEKQLQAFAAIEKEKSEDIIRKADLSTREGRIAASDAYSNLGAAYSRAGDFKNAEKNLLKSLDISYEQTPAHVNLGLLYKKQGKPDKALQHYEKALKLTSDSHVILNNIGRIHEDRGDLKKAEDFYRQALKLAPGNQVIARNLAKVLGKTKAP